VARTTFGTATGACGTLQQNALMYPGGHPRFDEYTVAFESSKTYVKHGSPKVVSGLDVFHL